MEVAAEVTGGAGEQIAVRSAVVGRTGRILMEGRAFLKW
jgi:2-methylaconitate cis-trans-isomerase PrpF